VNGPAWGALVPRIVGEELTGRAGHGQREPGAPEHAEPQPGRGLEHQLVDAGRAAAGETGAVDPHHDFLQAAPPDPVAVYLASLGSAESRRTMTSTLDRLASLLTGRPGTAAAATPWHLLRPEHTTHPRNPPVLSLPYLLRIEGW
jgi:hypothetical protein